MAREAEAALANEFKAGTLRSVLGIQPWQPHQQQLQQRHTAVKRAQSRQTEAAATLRVAYNVMVAAHDTYSATKAASDDADNALLKEIAAFKTAERADAAEAAADALATRAAAASQKANAAVARAAAVAQQSSDAAASAASARREATAAAARADAATKRAIDASEPATTTANARI